MATLLTNQQIIDSLMQAKSKIHLVRYDYTQFNLPLADAKLLRVLDYLSGQLAEIERETWADAELIER